MLFHLCPDSPNCFKFPKQKRRVFSLNDDRLAPVMPKIEISDPPVTPQLPQPDDFLFSFGEFSHDFENSDYY